MAAAFPVAREVFGEVDDVLKQKLSKLMFEGPGEELTLTQNTQPALMAVSIATLRVLESEGGFRLEEKAVLVAGHSLGEYSALAAAGSLRLAEAARLLRLRGEAMQRAVPAGEGAMAALLGWSWSRRGRSVQTRRCWCMRTGGPSGRWWRRRTTTAAAKW